MTGRWFTEGDEHGIHIQLFMDDKADGTYAKDIRAIDKCDVAGKGKETGTWRMMGNDFITDSKTVDGMPVDASQPDTHNVFTMTRIDEAHINLYDTETKITWALSLVEETTGFPAPRGCSV
jgi:hypothetical protein